MTPDDDENGKSLEQDSGATPHPDDGPVMQPEPEEVPELLGENSDYPIPFGDDGRER